MARTPPGEDGGGRGNSIEDRLTRSFEQVATTAERVGIPVATFAAGAVTLGLSAQAQQIPQLPWLGSGLVVASLLTYMWLTARSTVRVQAPPAPIPTEVQQQLDWMTQELAAQTRWMRELTEKLAFPRTLAGPSSSIATAPEHGPPTPTLN